MQLTQTKLRTESCYTKPISKINNIQVEWNSNTHSQTAGGLFQKAIIDETEFKDKK